MRPRARTAGTTAGVLSALPDPLARATAAPRLLTATTPPAPVPVAPADGAGTAHLALSRPATTSRATTPAPRTT